MAGGFHESRSGRGRLFEEKQAHVLGGALRGNRRQAAWWLASLITLGTVAQPLIAQNHAPSNVSVTPFSGSGSSQTFRYVYSDPEGWADIMVTQMLITTSGSGINDCWLWLDRAANSLWLAADNGTWPGPPAPPGGSLQNSQCIVDTWSYSGSVNLLTVDVGLTFKPGFAGLKFNYVNVFDSLWQSPWWQLKGTWMVTGTSCTYSISPSSQSFDSVGGAASVSVTAPSGCSWTATSNAAWITITAGASGSGNGSVSYSVATNAGTARTGTMTIAGQTFTVTQAAVAPSCTYSISPTSQSFSSAGGTASASVTAPSGCSWTATSNAAWITITAGASGSGNGSVSYSVATNAGTARTGTMTIAGQTFTVTRQQLHPPAPTRFRPPVSLSAALAEPTLATTGGTPPYAWSIPSGLPAGLSFPSSGVLSGAPTRGGQTFGFTVNVTDSLGAAATKDFTLPIGPSSPPIAWPSRLEVGLSYMPFDSYNYETPAISKFPVSCPSGSNVRGCFKTILANLFAQGVSGIRIFFQLCGPDSTPLVNCGLNWPSVGYKGNLTPPDLTWINQVNDFFEDVKVAGIQNITLTPVHEAGTLYPRAKILTAPPSGFHCLDTPDTVYFYATAPLGYKQVAGSQGIEYHPISPPDNQGYNCAPKNPMFVGWQNQYNVINAMLAAAAQKQLTVFELDFEQEMDLMNFPVLARYIVDNAQTDSGQPNVRDALRYYMSLHGFDPGRVTWSAPWAGSTLAGVNCTNVYTDYARLMGADQIAAAIGGGWIGFPNNPLFQGNLVCDNGAGTYPFDMFQMPTYGTQPNILDVHLRPCVGTSPSSCRLDDAGAAVQAEAKIDFSDIVHYTALFPSTSTVVLGETHSNTQDAQGAQAAATCEGGPLNAPAETVAGYNQSTLAGRSVVFRPWMQLQSPSGNCFTYPSNQRVNFQGGGPYTPTQQ